MRSTYYLLSLLLLLSIGGQAHSSVKKKGIRVLMVGGGSSHDFDRWYKQEDVATLERGKLAKVTYTQDPSQILTLLPDTDVLFLANNQPIEDKTIRKAIMAFSQAGKGVVLAHPALWYNWADWPEYNKNLVGGGARGHNKYGPFDVSITAPSHPVMKGVPAVFELDDELYYFKSDPEGSPIKVLATAKSTQSDAVFPSVFEVQYGKGRILGIALGHDAGSHSLPAYQSLIRNAVKWVSK